MQYLRILQNEKKIELNQFQFNKSQNQITISSEDGLISLVVQTPFNLSKIPDNLFDITRDIDSILTMRNKHFGEYNLINLKHRNNKESNALGSLFSLSGALIYDEYFKNNKHLVPYACRTIVSLMYGNTNYNPEPIEYRSDGEYSLFDWYPEDIIICALSKQLKTNIDVKLTTSLLFNLNSLGFYLTTNKNKGFYPKSSILQQFAISEILGEDGFGSFIFSNIEDSIVEEPFLKKYIRELINDNLDPVNRFILIYQCHEILIDYVLNSELSEKVHDGTKRQGHKLKELVYEISTESYRLQKLLKKYSNYPKNSDFESAVLIENLFAKYKPELVSEKSEYSSLFYKFRNQIVHNLRFFYEGDEEEISDKKDKIKDIIQKCEYMTIETIINLRLTTSI